LTDTLATWTGLFAIRTSPIEVWTFLLQSEPMRSQPGEISSTDSFAIWTYPLAIWNDSFVIWTDPLTFWILPFTISIDPFAVWTDTFAILIQFDHCRPSVDH
jgi:hypothetical protein